MKQALLSVLFLLECETAIAETYSQSLLPPGEETRWIEAFKGYQTADGATVLQVLETAQQLRPDRFKFGHFNVGFDSAGQPVGVGVDFWIGSKRQPEDAFNIGANVQKTGEHLNIELEGSPGSLQDVLNQGSTAFLKAVDQEYEEDCVDPLSRAKLC